MTAHLTVKEAICCLILLHPEWSSDDILEELTKLDFDIPTRFMVSSVKQTFRANVKFLKREGYVIGQPQGPLHRDLIRKPRRPKRKNSNVKAWKEPKPPQKFTGYTNVRHFYAKDSD